MNQKHDLFLAWLGTAVGTWFTLQNINLLLSMLAFASTIFYTWWKVYKGKKED